MRQTSEQRFLERQNRACVCFSFFFQGSFRSQTLHGWNIYLYNPLFQPPNRESHFGVLPGPVERKEGLGFRVPMFRGARGLGEGPTTEHCRKTALRLVVVRATTTGDPAFTHAKTVGRKCYLPNPEK